MPRLCNRGSQPRPRVDAQDLDTSWAVGSVTRGSQPRLRAPGEDGSKRLFGCESRKIERPQRCDYLLIDRERVMVLEPHYREASLEGLQADGTRDPLSLGFEIQSTRLGQDLRGERRKDPASAQDEV